MKPGQDMSIFACDAAKRGPPNVTLGGKYCPAWQIGI
jgi:hypothetical protein